MRTPNDKPINLANFNPKGKLGLLFAQARAFNNLNDQLSEFLPDAFKTLSLCAIKGRTATFVTHNQSVAFRAQKQHEMLLGVLKKLDALADIQEIVIKVDLKEY